MGEYADMAMESEMFEYMDAVHGEGSFDSSNVNYDEDCHGATLEGYQRYYKRNVKTEYTYIEFDKIVHETDKARLIRLSVGRDIWIPKSMHILTDNQVGINQWFNRKIHGINQ